MLKIISKIKEPPQPFSFSRKPYKQHAPKIQNNSHRDIYHRNGQTKKTNNINFYPKLERVIIKIGIEIVVAVMEEVRARIKVKVKDNAIIFKY